MPAEMSGRTTASSSPKSVFPLATPEIAKPALVNFGDAGQGANVLGVFFDGGE